MITEHSSESLRAKFLEVFRDMKNNTPNKFILIVLLTNDLFCIFCILTAAGRTHVAKSRPTLSEVKKQTPRVHTQLDGTRETQLENSYRRSPIYRCRVCSISFTHFERFDSVFEYQVLLLHPSGCSINRYLFTYFRVKYCNAHLYGNIGKGSYDTVIKCIWQGYWRFILLIFSIAPSE